MIMFGLLGVMFMLFLVLLALCDIRDQLKAAMERRYGRE